MLSTAMEKITANAMQDQVRVGARPGSTGKMAVSTAQPASTEQGISKNADLVLRALWAFT